MSTSNNSMNARTRWIAAFVKKNGRKPKVLHIGNVANNAYLNAKIMREAGVDCDVLCHDYYHIMGCPEWEECSFDANGVDHFSPNWKGENLHRFQRPRWFVQAPFELGVNYLLAFNSGAYALAENYWEQICAENRTKYIHKNNSFSLPISPKTKLKQVVAKVFRLFVRVLFRRNVAFSMFEGDLEVRVRGSLIRGKLRVFGRNKVISDIVEKFVVNGLTALRNFRVTFTLWRLRELIP